jgi:hypothetical protein
MEEHQAIQNDLQNESGEASPGPGLTYRSIVAVGTLFVFGLAPFWDQHSDHFGFGFFPVVAGIVFFYPVTLLVVVNLCLSANRCFSQSFQKYRYALLLDLLAGGLLVWMLFHNPELI